MTKVRCNYTNCFYNDAPQGYKVGNCINSHIELRVWYEGEKDIEHHECKSYEFCDKGDDYRKAADKANV